MQTYYIITDHLGTPQVLTDENQDVVWQSDATPFGEEQNPSPQQSLRFPGQYTDPESGYSYNYFRDYDPRLGRYVQSDPLGLYDGPNTYGYVYQNPLIYTDPQGLWGGLVLGGGIRLIGGRAAGRAVTGGAKRAFGPTVGPALACLALGYCSESDEDEGESCPSTDPEDWEKIPGSNQAYRPKGEKEPIFEKDRSGDRSHGGSAWKKWDKAKDWAKGKPRSGTYDKDGNRLRD